MGSDLTDSHPSFSATESEWILVELLKAALKNCELSHDSGRQANHKTILISRMSRPPGPMQQSRQPTRRCSWVLTKSRTSLAGLLTCIAGVRARNNWTLSFVWAKDTSPTLNQGLLQHPLLLPIDLSLSPMWALLDSILPGSIFQNYIIGGQV